MPRYPLAAAGITKLSELTIDANKDWAIKGIDSLGFVIIEDGAGHYMRLPSLTTAQRDDLTPAVGMAIWNSTTTQVEKYDGSDWGSMGIAGVKVRKNTQMPILGTRPQLNFIEGASIQLELQDNPPDDEIDITVHAKYPTRFMTLIPDDAALHAADGAAALSSVDGTNFTYECLDFDATTEEAAFWEWYLTPDYLSENIVVDIYWITADADTGHNAVFGFSTLGREKGETWDSALGTERTVVSPNGGAGVVNKARITTFAPGWSPGDVLEFKLARKAADASDTVDQDARVLKVVVSYTGEFAQSFYPLPEPVKLNVVSGYTWADVDVSAYVPAGATGVILHYCNGATGGLGQNFGLRKKGSTDDRHGDSYHNFWAMIGIDENRKFQCYVDEALFFGDEGIYLVGYTATGVVFLDNAYDHVLDTLNDWTNIDLSTECPGAIGIIIETLPVGATTRLGVRKNGSTDNRVMTFSPYHKWWIIGCDGSQVIQYYSQNATQHFYIVGYVTKGAVFKTNANDKTPSPDAWEEIDCSVEAPKAVMLFFETHNVNGRCQECRWGMRKHGSTENLTRSAFGRPWAFVPCDSSQKVDGYMEQDTAATDLDFFLVGYATWAGA